MRRLIAPLCLVLLLPLLGSCTTLQQVASLRRVDFDINGVSGTRLAGVNVEQVRSYQDLGTLDAARIAGALAQGELPLAFTLHVGAQNPADNPVAARLVRMDWTLLLDDTETISGIYNDERLIPPGEATDIPISMNLDLIRFFGRNLSDLFELGLAVAGQGTKEVALRVRPTINTPIGSISYPGELTLVRRTIGG